jgi:hypothetical protein
MTITAPRRLSDDQIREILSSSAPHSRMAAAHSVSPEMIRHIRHGTRYASICPDLP